MERAPTLLALTAGLIGMTGTLAAGPLNLNFSADRTRLDVQRTETGNTNLSKESWGYKVTVENKSFQNLEGLELEYRVFLLEDEARLRERKLKGNPGAHTIAALKNREKQQFQTIPVEVNKSELKAGWSYTNRAIKEKVKDGLGGIWIRVKKDGAIVAEYVNPPALKQRASFD
ncbi:MAG TPA: hypothetical protein VF614_05845 [Chthoniobacteraceae bacterium]|jgi:hypothetical protein